MNTSQSARKPRTLRGEILNVPNLLTMGRIALIPPVMLLMLWGTPEANFYAALLFSIAAITDWLDGFLARRQGLESVFGKFLDPLADKLIVLATLIVATQLHHVPGWFVVLLLSRELAVTGLRALAGNEGFTIDVVRTGKYKTALQLLGIIGIILHERYLIDFGFAERVIDFNLLGIGLLSLSLFFSLLSAGIYFYRFTQAAAAQPDRD
ncbi:MAG: CDP-diacylglycerol--glycerol-3-phosphate 3-phosphatidyltransferase [Myxococcota bacterium]|jgi:CDP-diacylglycerol--glycerol-3-phosphate 3-phosphatidyltransferase